MNTETFRVDFLRLPFLALGLALAAYAAYVVFTVGAWAVAGALVPLAIGMAMGWYFGVVQVNDSGIVLYRTYRVQWNQISGARRLFILTLPYLLVRRTSGFAWFLPLDVTGPRSLAESLTERAPRGTAFAAALRSDLPALQPGAKREA
jgi:hypothetical protein